MINFSPSPTWDIGPLHVQVWGVMVALGMIVGVVVAVFEARRRGNLRLHYIFDASLWIIFGGLIGARVFYFFDRWHVLQQNPLELFRVWDGGMAIYGGIVGAGLALLWFSKTSEQNLLELADIFVFALPAGLFVGRLGCVAIHDHLGKVTTMPWGFLIDGVIRHEPALYLSAMNVLIFFIFWQFRKNNPRRFRGFYLMSFLILYGLGRFVVDETRAATGLGSDPHFWGWSFAQYLSLASILAGFLLIALLRRQDIRDL